MAIKKDKKNVVFPKTFWVTFGKVTVSDAKPAQSNEKHLFAKAKSAIGRILRSKIIEEVSSQRDFLQKVSKNSSRKTVFFKASTLPELMVVMIIAGIVIGLLFDGVELFRRYSNQITSYLTQNSQLLTVINYLTTVTESSDSIREEQEIITYRKGAAHTTITLSDSLLTINNDTLPIKTNTLSVRADTLIVETGGLTLYFPIRRKLETEVMKQIEGKEHEVTLEK